MSRTRRPCLTAAASQMSATMYGWEIVWPQPIWIGMSS